MRVFCRLLLWLSVFIGQAANACEMVFRAYDFPPLAMQDKQGQWQGLDLDYARALMKKIDCDMNIVRVPWARGLELLKVGKIDFMVNVSKNEAREKYYHFIGPYRTEKIRLVSKKGKITPIETWEQLVATDFRLMRQKGSYFGERFEQLLANNFEFRQKLLELPNNLTRIELLEKGRIGGFMSEELFVDYQLSQPHNGDPLYKHPLIIYTDPIFYAFSKAKFSDEQIIPIRQAFEQLAKNKDYQQIQFNYSP